MEIEIKNLKIAASLSEETTAYTADIFVDGVKTFAASNHGHGGGDMYHRLPGAKVTESDVNAWLAVNCPPDGPYATEMPRSAYDMGHACDLEAYVGRFIAHVESSRETARIRRNYAKKLADRICCMRTEKGRDVFLIFGKASHKPTPENLAFVRNRNPDVVVLNDADDATKARGLRAMCPEIDAVTTETDEQLREAVYERLRTDALTVADAKWLLAQDNDVGRPDADVQAHLRDVIERGEAAYAVYVNGQQQRAARDAAGALVGQVS